MRPEDRFAPEGATGRSFRADPGRLGATGRVGAVAAVVVLVGTVVLGLAVWNRTSLGIAALVGVLLGLLVSRMVGWRWRNVRVTTRERDDAGVGDRGGGGRPSGAPRRRWRYVLAAALVATGVWVLLVLALGTLPHGGVSPQALTVPFQASGTVTGNTLLWHEEIVLDQTTVDALQRILRDQGSDTADLDPRAIDQANIDGWLRTGTTDGFPVYGRDRVAPVKHKSLAVAAATIDISIGTLTLAPPSSPKPLRVELRARAGSLVSVRASKGAIAMTFPPPVDVADTLHGGEEQATIRLDDQTDYVAVDLLTTAFRNPAGRSAYQVLSWGPLVWLTGAGALAVGAGLGRKLLDALFALPAAIGRRLRDRPGEEPTNVRQPPRSLRSQLQGRRKPAGRPRKRLKGGGR